MLILLFDTLWSKQRAVDILNFINDTPIIGDVVGRHPELMYTIAAPLQSQPAGPDLNLSVPI
jgi:hypothetical protein